MTSTAVAARSRLVYPALLVAAAGIVIDMASKWFIVSYVMNPPRTIPVTPWFNIVLFYNSGISFGLFATEPGGPATWALVAIAMCVVAVLFSWLLRIKDAWDAASIGAIIGGALANVIDRLRQGAVTDFLDFYLDDWHWPAFNLADCFIVSGVCLLMVRSFAPKSR